MRWILLFVFLLAFMPVKAQTEPFLFIGGGLSGAYTGGIGGLDFAVDRYNETRNWLDDEMGNFSFLTGFNLTAGMNLAGFTMDITYSRRSSTSTAGGTQPINNQYAERDLKFVLSALSFGFSYMLYNEDRELIHGPGFSIDLPTVSVSTKISTSDEYQDIIDGDGNVAFSFYWQFYYAPFRNSSFMFAARPYYQMFLTDNDYFLVNKIINRTTYFNDDYDATKGMANNLGFDIQFIYVSDFY